MSPKPSAVVLRALKLGDLLTAVPALRAIRRHLPDHHLMLATPAWLEPLAHLTDAVDQVVDTATLAPLDDALDGAELAFNLHGRGPQSSALLAGTNPRQLIGFFHPDVPATAGGPVWKNDEHEVRRWCRLLVESGLPADPTDLQLPAPAVDPVPGAAGAILLHPGASSPARRWPVDRWADLARHLTAAGHEVVLTASGDEVMLAEAVAVLGKLSTSSVLAGRTTLLELTASVARARLVVSGDTGIAHLASAYGIPSVVLFGPTAPSSWGPPARGPHTVLWTGREGDPHSDRVDRGLLSITTEEVLAAACSRLSNGSSPGCEH